MASRGEDLIPPCLDCFLCVCRYLVLVIIKKETSGHFLWQTLLLVHAQVRYTSTRFGRGRVKKLRRLPKTQVTGIQCSTDVATSHPLDS